MEIDDEPKVVELKDIPEIEMPPLKMSVPELEAFTRESIRNYLHPGLSDWKEPSPEYRRMDREFLRSIRRDGFARWGRSPITNQTRIPSMEEVDCILSQHEIDKYLD